MWQSVASVLVKGRERSAKYRTKRTRRRARRLTFEPLEPRVLLDGAFPLAIGAQQNQPAPDTGPDVTFRLLGEEPTIARDGSIAFVATTEEEDGGFGSRLDGVWAGAAGDLRLIAREGETAPGTGTAFDEFSFVSRYQAGVGGTVAFIGELDVSGLGRTGVWAGGPGSLQLVMRGGESAAGVPGGTYGRPGSGFDVEVPAINPAGQVSIIAELTEDGTTLPGVWQGAPNALESVARGGAPAPGIPDSPFGGSAEFGLIRSSSAGTFNQGAVLNNAGQTAFLANVLYDGSFGLPSQAIFFGGPGTLQPIVDETVIPPGGGGASLAFIGLVSGFNDAGQVLYTGSLSQFSNPAATRDDDAGLWIVDGTGQQQLVVREGDPAPGTIGVFGSTFDSPFRTQVLGGSGQVVIHAQVTGPGIDESNDQGIWVGLPGDLRLVAQKGTAAPGAGGATFVDFEEMAINSSGTVAFLGTTSDPGPAGTGADGIWATNEAGDLQLVALEGDTATLGGESLNVSFISMTGNSGGQDGRLTALNDTGQFVFHATVGGLDTIILAELPGVVPPPRADIGDFVFDDLDADGIQDVGEPGIAGVDVRLIQSTDGVIGNGDDVDVRQVFTDAQGGYRFTEVEAGQYYIQVSLPSGRTFTLANQGTDTTDSDVVPSAGDPAKGVSAIFSFDGSSDDLMRDAGLTSRLFVNSTGDAPDDDPGDGVIQTGNLIDVGGVMVPEVTLRAALMEVAAGSFSDPVIAFNIPTTDPDFTGGVYTVMPTEPLPSVVADVWIDATTQAGFVDAPIIQISGGLAGEFAHGLHLIGGNTRVEGLVINSFTGDGVRIDTSGGNRLFTSYIGVDATGTVALPNGGAGVFVDNTPGNQIGALNEGLGNVISGNTGDGVHVTGPMASGHVIQGNLIGTVADGAMLIGNGGNGVAFTNQASDNLVGGQHDIGAGNTIAGNGAAGVFVDQTVTMVTLLSNSIFTNGGLGIDLAPVGVTANDIGAFLFSHDEDEGANRLQNFPDLVVSPEGAITATLRSRANTTFTVEVFGNGECDPSGHGEGQTFLGTFDIATDASGLGMAVAPFNAAGGVTATATDPEGNTSEFSFCTDNTVDIMVEAFSHAPAPQGASDAAPGLLAVTYDLRNSLADPFTFDFLTSMDGLFDMMDGDAGFQIVVDPMVIDDESGLRLFDADGRVEVAADLALSRGTHTLVFDPAQLTGGAGLISAIEDPEVEIVLVVADRADDIAEEDATPINEDNIAALRGVYQASGAASNKAVIRTGFDSDDEATVSIPLLGGGLDLTIDGLDNVHAAGASDLLVVTSTGDDFVHLDNDLTVNALVKGGAGGDTIIGGAGDDRLEGGDGFDVILGDGFGLTVDLAKDFALDLKARKLDFTAFPSAIQSVGDGADHLLGGDGFDVMLGGSGPDVLEAGAGGSILFGDAFSVSTQAPVTITFDDLFGGSDDDKTKSKGLFARARELLTFDPVTFSLMSPSDGADTVIGGTGLDLAFGGGKNDLMFTGGGPADAFYGNDGDGGNPDADRDDRLFSNQLSSSDPLVTGLGDDVEFAGQSASLFSILDGGLGNDELVAGGIANYLVGDDGDDLIVGTGGIDVILGDVMTGNINGLLDLLSNLEMGKFKLGVELTSSGRGDDTILGMGGTDAIIGGDGSDLIDARGVGLAGSPNGAFIFGDAFDIVANIDLDLSNADAGDTSGSGKTRRFKGLLRTALALLTQIDAKLVGGGQGESMADPDNGNDVIFGSDGAGDLIIAGAGNDQVHTGGGLTDIVFGNDHNDTIMGEDTDFLLAVAGLGDDTIDFSASTGIAGGALFGDSFDFINIPLDLTSLLNIEWADGDLLPTKFFIEGGVIQSGGGKDIIKGTQAAISGNFILAGDGDDHVTGGGLVDIIFGDSINVGGKFGIDFSKIELPGLIEGAAFVANQVFGFNDTGDGKPTLFESISDLINLDDAISNELPGLAGSGNDTLFGSAGQDLGGDFFNFIVAGDGDDFVHGGYGGVLQIDVLFGNDGEDNIFGHGGQNAIFGGNDNDDILGSDGDVPLPGDEIFDINFIAGDSIGIDLTSLPRLLRGGLLAGTDLLSTGVGDDNIWGGPGADVLVGGDGHDCIRGRDGFNLAFGDGLTVRDLAETFVPEFVMDTDAFFDDLTDENDVFNVLNYVAQALAPSVRYDDEYLGGDDTDIALGGLGDDILIGGRGRNILIGNEGVDAAPPGLGIDFVFLAAQVFAQTTCFENPTIEGVKFNDLDADGERDPEEPTLSNWTIQVFEQVGEELVFLSQTGTDAEGKYKFSLDPGTYVVQEVLKPGWTQTRGNPDPITVDLDDQVTDIDFGNVEVQGISGTKFEDVDGDGERDDLEEGVAGFIIRLERPDGSLVTSTETDAEGRYVFDDIEAGDYVVKEVEQQGWQITTDNAIDVTFDGTNGVGNIDFGNFETIEISGTKYEDTNGNGTRDAGEPGLAGWTIQLDLNADGTIDDSEVTDANGDYVFEFVGPGDPGATPIHLVTEVIQPGWVQTQPGPEDDLEHEVERFSGVDVGGVDFGNFEAIDIGGTKFEDEDGDGVRDPGEPGLSGWTIYLDINENGVLDDGEPSTVTDPFGDFLFQDIGPITDGFSPASVTIREVDQDGWTPTLSQPTGIAMLSGQDITGVLFGNFENVIVRGLKFNDLDGNGVRTIDEPPLEGTFFGIDLDSDGVVDAATDVSGDDGMFTLEIGPDPDDADGLFDVIELDRLGFVQTSPFGGGGFQHVLTSGAEYDVEFGNFELVTVSGTKFADLNGNGVNDGEPFLAGWRVTLDLDDDGTIDAERVTDANGSYTFEDVGPGEHRVAEAPTAAQQAQWSQTFPTGDGDHTFEAASGGDRTFDFGNRPLQFVAGRVFHDLDADGLFEPAPDANEPTLAGWTVYLDANNDGLLNHPDPMRVGVCDPSSAEFCTVTDQGGRWVFPVGLGTQIVRAVPRAGWDQTTPDPFVVVVEQPTQSFDNINIGQFQRATFAGVAYDDRNNSGDRDAGESGLPGLTVYLDDNGNNQFDPGEASTLTQADGSFVLGDIPLGSHRVAQVVPAGTTIGSPAGAGFDVLVSAGGTAVAGLDFANQRFASITGRVFDDDNRDGVQDAGEPGLENWTVYLDANANGTLDAQEQSTDTDATGLYHLTDVPPGQHTVAVVQQDDFDVSAPEGGTYNVNVTGGDDLTDRDFGVFLNPGQMVMLSDQTFKSLTFETDDGTSVTLSIRDAEAEILITGDNLNQQEDRRGVLVTGDGLALGSIVLRNTTTRTQASLRTRGGGGEVVVGDIVVEGPANRLDFRSAALAGDLSTGPVKSLFLGTVADDHLITIDPSDDPRASVTIMMGRVENTRIESGMPIRSLTVTDWLDTNAVADRVHAPWLGNLTARGDRRKNIDGHFQADLLLDLVGLIGAAPRSTLNNAKFTGDLSDADWLITGDSGPVSANNVHDFSFELNSALRQFKAKAVSDTTLDVDGDAGTIAADSWVGGGVDAESLKQVTIKNDVVDWHLNLTSTYRTINLGDASGVNISAQGDGGTVRFKRWIDGSYIGRSVRGMNSTGDRRAGFAGDALFDLSLAGIADARKPTLGNTRLAGDLLGGKWTVVGDGQGLNANSIAKEWVGDFVGDVKTISIKQDLAGSLTANTVSTINVGGDARDLTLRFNQPVVESDSRLVGLGRLNVRNATQNTTITSAGILGTIQTGTLFDSVIYAGVNENVVGLPTVTDDFDSPALIRGVTVKGLRDQPFAFGNTLIAALQLDRSAIVGVMTDNSGTTFGIAAQFIASLKVTTDTDTIQLSNVLSGSAPDPIDDFEIRLI